MVLVDTGALLAMLDADESHHRVLREAVESRREPWLVPSVVLPEVDYLVRRELGDAAGRAFFADLAEGRWEVAWLEPRDLESARALDERHATLGLGFVDASVLAIAARLRAGAIATLDLRHFAAVDLPHRPRLYPRDL